MLDVFFQSMYYEYINMAISVGLFIQYIIFSFLILFRKVQNTDVFTQAVHGSDLWTNLEDHVGQSQVVWLLTQSPTTYLKNITAAKI